MRADRQAAALRLVGLVVDLARRRGRGASDEGAVAASVVDRERPGVKRAGPRRECRALSIVVRTVLRALPATSPTMREAAETTPRAPATVAVRASEPMSAAPDTALRSTSRANCRAPTATIPTRSTAPRSTRGTTLASTPPSTRPRPGVLFSFAFLRAERARPRDLGLAMSVSLPFRCPRRHDTAIATT